MGRVIKEDEQPDVTPASFEDNAFPTESETIPRENVSTPPDAEDEDEEEFPVEGQVLRNEEMQWADRSVTVSQVPEPDPSPAEKSSQEEELDDSSPEGEGSPSESEGTSTRTDEEWQERLEEAVEEARSDGYEEGYEAGYEEGYEEAEETLRAEHEEQREALLEDITRFEEQWKQYIDESEPMLVELALQLAETIVDVPLTDSLRKASEEALTDAVAELATAPPVTVTVHPVDYQRLHESGLVERLQEKYEELHLESDPDCAEGDWSVASPEGVIRRLRSEVVETLRKRLRLAPSEPASDAE